MLLTLGRVIKLGINNFWRNIWLSLATVLVLSLTLLTFTVLTSLNILASTAIKDIESKIDITIYFDEIAKESDVLDLEKNLSMDNRVADTQYISEVEALQKFEARYKDDADIAETLRELGVNPLGKSLIIKAEHIEDYAGIVEGLENNEETGKIVDEINYKDNNEVIDRLVSLKQAVRRAGFAVSGFLGLIAILVTFNTIRLTIYSRRREISIMKLVGASNWFIRWPLFVEGLLYGLISALLTLIIFYPLVLNIAPKIDLYFKGSNLNLMQFFWDNAFRIIGWEILIGVGLGVISSFFAVRRYLRV